MEINYKPRALEDIEYFKKSGNKKLLNKIQSLITEMETHPETSTGKPEMLKHQLSGFWSRRINSEHRIIYETDYEAGKVYIYSLRGHY